jgi:hypothetical protein
MPLDDTTGSGSDPFRDFNSKSPIMFQVGERPVAWFNRVSEKYENVTSHKAIVRSAVDGKGGRVLNVVGANYKLVTNKELFTAVEDTMRKKMHDSALDGVQVSDEVSGFGRVCLRKYVFPNIKCKLSKGSRSDIAFRLIVQNGYGGSALRIHAGAIEFYCSNGMISGEYQSEYRKHTAGLVVAGIESTLERAVDSFASSATRWQRWANTPVPHEQAMQLFRDLASSDKLAERLAQQHLRDRHDRGANLYSVYSTLTYYASHSEGEFKLRSTVQEQDNVAATMLQRELAVAKWTESDAWRAVEKGTIG